MSKEDFKTIKTDNEYTDILDEEIDMDAAGRDGWYRLSGEPDPRNEFQKRRDAVEGDKQDKQMKEITKRLEEHWHKKGWC